MTLRKKCPYSEFFWSVFSRIWTECGPEKLRITRVFTQYAKRIIIIASTETNLTGLFLFHSFVSMLHIYVKNAHFQSESTSYLPNLVSQTQERNNPNKLFVIFDTAWKMSKYGLFSGPNTGKYGPEKTPYLDILHAVW